MNFYTPTCLPFKPIELSLMIKSRDLSILLQSTYLEGDETELFSSTSSDQVKAYCKEYYDYLALSRT